MKQIRPLSRITKKKYGIDLAIMAASVLLFFAFKTCAMENISSEI